MIQGQLGEMTRHGPVIHLPTFQIEAPADVLRDEGWGVPEFGGEEPEMVRSLPGANVPSAALESAAAQIVDALLNADEMDIAKTVAVQGPRRLGRPERTLPRPQRRPMRLTR